MGFSSMADIQGMLHTRMRLLITGGCGFIGSNFVRFVLEHYQQEFVSNVDALTYAGNPDNLVAFPNATANVTSSFNPILPTATRWRPSWPGTSFTRS